MIWWWFGDKNYFTWPNRELNPRPFAPEAIVMPWDNRALRFRCLKNFVDHFAMIRWWFGDGLVTIILLDPIGNWTHDLTHPKRESCRETNEPWDLGVWKLCWWFRYDLDFIRWWFGNDLVMIRWWFGDDLVMIWWWFVDYLVMIWWSFGDHLLIKIILLDPIGNWTHDLTHPKRE